DARDERRVVLGFRAADDGRLEAGSFLVRQAAANRGRAAERGGQELQFGERSGAVAAQIDVRRHGNLIADRQLAVVKRLQAPPRRRACETLHAVLASRSSTRSA